MKKGNYAKSQENLTWKFQVLLFLTEYFEERLFPKFPKSDW